VAPDELLSVLCAWSPDASEEAPDSPPAESAPQPGGATTKRRRRRKVSEEA
jgi:hypothetical protein